MNDHTVTILEKDGMFASMAIDKGDNAVAYVGRNDARCNPPNFYQTVDKFEHAVEMLNTYLKISESRGWRVIYQGQRNSG